jgi:hypothetical protein
VEKSVAAWAVGVKMAKLPSIIIAVNNEEKENRLSIMVIKIIRIKEALA